MKAMANKPQEPVPQEAARIDPADPFKPEPDLRAGIAANAAPVMIWMASAEQRFDWFNTACESFTGFRADELVGQGWLGCVHPEDLERYSGILETSYQARQPFSLDYRLRRHDGEYRWMLDN